MSWINELFSTDIEDIKLIEKQISTRCPTRYDDFTKITIGCKWYLKKSGKPYYICIKNDINNAQK